MVPAIRASFVVSMDECFSNAITRFAKTRTGEPLRRLLDPEFDTRATQSALGGSTESVNNPHRLAKAVLEHFDHPEHRTLLLNNGSLYSWNGVWTLRDDDSIRRMIWRVAREEFMDHAQKMMSQGNDAKVLNVSTTLVNNVFGAVRSTVEANAKIGDWLVGGGPPASDLLICNNRIVDLRGFVDGKHDCLFEHSPRLFVQNKLPFDFDPAAPSPERWHQFLEELWPEDVDSRLLLQQFFGYVLTNDSSMQKFLMLLGARRAGKGVISRLLGELVGKENTCSIRLRKLGDQFALAGAVGKSLLLIPDASMPSSDKASEIVEVLKAITGGDELDVDRKHLPALSTAIPAKVVISSNNMIDLPDNSKALYERMSPLLFSNSFANNPDTKLVRN